MPVARRETTSVNLKVPSFGTLSSYGLTVDDWLEMVHRQDYSCPVCGQPFGDRPLVIDHEHVKGWRARKRKTRDGIRRATKGHRVMTPAERRVYVRGVLHSFCNRYVRRWLTLEFVQRVGPYLEAHRARREAETRTGG